MASGHTRLSSKCPELSDPLLKLKAEGRWTFGAHLDELGFVSFWTPFFEGCLAFAQPFWSAS